MQYNGRNADISWYFMIFHDISWYFMIFHDISWYFMIFHDISWYFMIFHDISWYFMIFHDISWYFMIFHDISWYFMIFHDISWYFMIFHDISSRNSSRSWYVFWLRSTQRADVRKAGTLAQRAERLSFAQHGTAGAKISDLGSAPAPGHQGTRHSQQRKGRWQVISGSPPAKCNRVQMGAAEDFIVTLHFLSKLQQSTGGLWERKLSPVLSHLARLRAICIFGPMLNMTWACYEECGSPKPFYKKGVYKVL